MKFISKIVAISFTLIFLWMLFVTASPIKLLGLDKKYSICEISSKDTWSSIQAKLAGIKGDYSYIQFIYPKQDQRPLFQCKKYIPSITIYRAKTINAVVKLNQPVEFNIGLCTGGMGPTWKALIKPEEINKPVRLSWSLDREQSTKTLKFNWLPENFTGGGVYIEKADPNKDLIITIYEMYLE